MSLTKEEVISEGFNITGSTADLEEWTNLKYSMTLFRDMTKNEFFIRWDHGSTTVMCKDHLMNIVRILHA